MDELRLMTDDEFFRGLVAAVEDEEAYLGSDLLDSDHAGILSEQLYAFRQEFLRRMGGKNPETEALFEDLSRAIIGFAKDEPTPEETWKYLEMKQKVLDLMRATREQPEAVVNVA